MHWGPRYHVAGEMHDVWHADDELAHKLPTVLLLPSLDAPLTLSVSQSVVEPPPPP